MARGNLFPSPEITPAPTVVEGQSLNHCTAGKVPMASVLRWEQACAREKPASPRYGDGLGCQRTAVLKKFDHLYCQSPEGYMRPQNLNWDQCPQVKIIATICWTLVYARLHLKWLSNTISRSLHNTMNTSKQAGTQRSQATCPRSHSQYAGVCAFEREWFPFRAPVLSLCRIHCHPGVGRILWSCGCSGITWGIRITPARGAERGSL